MIKAVFCDLFMTLIYPYYEKEDNENDVVGIDRNTWEEYVEAPGVGMERGLGIIKTEEEIVDKIADVLPFEVTSEQKKEIIRRREHRMEKAMLKVDSMILDTLSELKKQGIKTCLISNADVIDCKHWQDSPLAQFFDEAIFSCYVGMLKPDPKIFQLAMEKMDVSPRESIYIGDGGGDEMLGAREVGMTSVLTEYLQKKDEKTRKKIFLQTDYQIKDFNELLSIIESQNRQEKNK